MSHRLADFLEELLHARQLVRVSAEVDCVQEISEITRRVAGDSGAALLFDRVRGHKAPVVTNLLGTPERLCRAIGVNEIGELAERVASVVGQSSPQNWLDRLRMSNDAPSHEKFTPRVVKSGPCQQVVRLGRDVKLSDLPALTCWPDQTGRVLSAAKLVAQLDGRPRATVTLCRAQIIDETHVAVVDDGQPALKQLWAQCQSSGEKQPLAITLGGDPVQAVAASLPRFGQLDVYTLCGVLRGAAVDLVKCRASQLEIPTDADLVLEGTLDPAAAPVEVLVAGLGTGHFHAARGLVMHVAAITQRNSPILTAMVESASGGELAVLRKAHERLLWPLVAQAAPELVDYALPPIGGQQNFAFVSIRKTAPRQAQKVASALWGLDPLAATKFLIVVDEQVDVHDTAAVWGAVGANVDPGRDLFTHQGPGNPTDHAAARPGLGDHVGFDATAKLGAEHPRAWPARLTADQEIQALVDAQWSKYGLPARPVSG